MNQRWLFRMKRLVQNPPSEGKVKLVFFVIAACAALYAYEYFYGWPEALTLDPSARRGYKP